MDGRGVVLDKQFQNGNFVGPTIINNVDKNNRAYTEGEIIFKNNNNNNNNKKTNNKHLIQSNT